MSDLRSRAIEAMARAQVIHTNGNDQDYDNDIIERMEWNSHAAKALDALVGFLKANADEWWMEGLPHVGQSSPTIEIRLLAVLEDDTLT